MSEEMIPDVEITSDVPERKSLAEIVKAFDELLRNEDKMKMSKEVEALKSAFYRTLAREKAEVENVEESPLAEIENVTLIRRSVRNITELWNRRRLQISR